MNLPERMVNRWEHRADLKPGQAQLYWHVLFQHHPQVRALASIGQEKLGSFPGLHFTPLRWLHITTFSPGPAVQLTPTEIEDLVTQARLLASNLPAVTIKLGKVLYHPEAIVLSVKPADALDPVLKAVQQATELFAGKAGSSAHTPWTPHVTLAYSTIDQPASPIIAALGNELPSCEVTVDSISLVLQEGPERLWNWRPLADVHFAGSDELTLTDP